MIPSLALPLRAQRPIEFHTHQYLKVIINQPPYMLRRRRALATNVVYSVSSFASNFILIEAAFVEKYTSSHAASIRMEFEAKLEALDDIRCLLFVGVNHHKRPGLKRSVC